MLCHDPSRRKHHPASGQAVNQPFVLQMVLKKPKYAASGPLGLHLGIITIIAVETGLLTPPLGLSAFVVKGALEDQAISLEVIFQGCAPFVIMMLVAVALVYAFPVIALFPLS